jgi:hypothetical protein
MTALPDMDSIKLDREIQQALNAAGPFDARAFQPASLRAAWAIAREWRQTLKGGTPLNDQGRS